MLKEKKEIASKKKTAPFVALPDGHSLAPPPSASPLIANKRQSPSRQIIITPKLGKKVGDKAKIKVILNNCLQQTHSLSLSQSCNGQGCCRVDHALRYLMHQHTDSILEATLRIVFLFSDFHNPSMSLPPALTHLALQNKLLTQSLFIFLLTSSYGRHCIRPLSGGFSASWTKVKFSFGPTSTRATPP